MSLINFIADDVKKTLFPLRSAQVAVELGETELTKFVDDQIFSTAQYHPTFVQAPIAFALRDRLHTRLVHLLDPVATLFIYRLVYANKNLFHRPSSSAHRKFGYYFNGTTAANASDEHQAFRRRIIALKKQFAYFAKFDISHCFASFYHHDIVSAFKTYFGEHSANQLGTFLRQINGGRSVSCFPQGYYPTKAMGNLFLSFIEENGELKSPVVIRYVDDFYVFSNSLKELESDFYRLQTSLAARNLYLNAAKTVIGDTASAMQLPKTDNIRKNLLSKRVEAIVVAYDPGDGGARVHLSEDEFAYLSGLISGSDATEEDVELALALITEDEHHAEQLTRFVFTKYPHLIRSLHAHLSNAVYESSILWDLIGEISASNDTHEFVLFWCARIIIDYYEQDLAAAKLLMNIYDHHRASDAVKAAILEHDCIEYGFVERKESVLKNTGASLLAISAAVGLHGLERARRNQLYKYAAASSPLMSEITKVLSKK